MSREAGADRSGGVTTEQEDDFLFTGDIHQLVLVMQLIAEAFSCPYNKIVSMT